MPRSKSASAYCPYACIRVSGASPPRNIIQNQIPRVGEKSEQHIVRRQRKQGAIRRHISSAYLSHMTSSQVWSLSTTTLAVQTGTDSPDVRSFLHSLPVHHNARLIASRTESEPDQCERDRGSLRCEDNLDRCTAESEPLSMKRAAPIFSALRSTESVNTPSDTYPLSVI